MIEVQQIDHINIDTKDLAATCAFYEKVLDLKPGPTPDTGRPLQWMYAGDRPLFHIGQPLGDEDVAEDLPRGYGFAHIALHIADFDIAKQRLEDNDIEYRVNTLSRPREVRQLFFQGPDGVEIELIEVGELTI